MAGIDAILYEIAIVFIDRAGELFALVHSFQKKC